MMETGLTLAELIGRSRGGPLPQPPVPSRPLPIQARVLKDVLAERQKPNPFAVGDLVQQRKEFYRYTIDFGIVSRIGAVAGEQRSGGDSIEQTDIVVLVESRGQWVEFPVESWRFEKYTGEIA